MKVTVMEEEDVIRIHFNEKDIESVISGLRKSGYKIRLPWSGHRITDVIMKCSLTNLGSVKSVSYIWNWMNGKISD